MKKEYIKPSLLLLVAEPSQILAGSQGGDGNGGMYPDVDGDGIPDYGGDDGDGGDADEGGNLSKGGLWDDLYW